MMSRILFIIEPNNNILLEIYTLAELHMLCVLL